MNNHAAFAVFNEIRQIVKRNQRRRAVKQNAKERAEVVTMFQRSIEQRQGVAR